MSVAEKLQVKKERRLALADSPLSIEAPAAPLGQAEIVVQFVRNRAEFDAKIPAILKAIRADAILWVAYPKRSGKVKSDLSRDAMWPPFERIGWRPVSQVSIDETWSALRFRPIEDVVKR